VQVAVGIDTILLPGLVALNSYRALRPPRFIAAREFPKAMVSWLPATALVAAPA
jgi:hypothetical protein